MRGCDGWSAAIHSLRFAKNTYSMQSRSRLQAGLHCKMSAQLASWTRTQQTYMPRLCISRRPVMAASSSVLYPTDSALLLGYPNASASYKVAISQFRPGATMCFVFRCSRRSMPGSVSQKSFSSACEMHHTFFIDVGSMVDDVHTMLHAHLHRVSRTRVCTQSLSKLVSLLNTSCCLFVGEVAVLRRSYLCDLSIVSTEQKAQKDLSNLLLPLTC